MGGVRKTNIESAPDPKSKNLDSTTKHVYRQIPVSKRVPSPKIFQI